MLILISIFYKLLPLLIVASVITSLIWRYNANREAAARKLREQRRKEHEDDCWRAGANIRLERWRRQVNHWRASKLQDALMAGAKRIDQMRTSKKNALR